MLKIEREAFDRLAELAEDVDGRLRPDYVGRGPTAPCVAFVAAGPSPLVQWLLSLGIESQDDEEVAAIVDAMHTSRTSSDDLGLDVVYYWTGVVVKDV
jgi:hypothetical protein